MTAKFDRSAAIELVRSVMGETDTSQKRLAKNAGAAESVISDALSAAGTRNLSLEWLLNQDDAFLDRLTERIRIVRGLNTESRRTAKAALVAELVRVIFEEVA